MTTLTADQVLHLPEEEFDQYYVMRSPSGSVVSSIDSTLIHSGTQANSISKFSDHLFRVLLSVESPTSLASVLALTGLPTGSARVLLSSLTRSEALVCAHVDQLDEDEKGRVLHRPLPLWNKVSVGVSGAINAASVLPHLLQLQRYVTEPLDVILTRGATRFLSATALQAYGMRVWTRMYDVQKDIRVPHVHLGEKTDLFVVLPASARTLQRLANGACSDLLSLSIAAADRCPVALVPSMNPRMWRHAPIARNVEFLRQAGMFIVLPGLAGIASENLSRLVFTGMGLGPSNIVPVLRAITQQYERRAAAPGLPA